MVIQFYDVWHHAISSPRVPSTLPRRNGRASAYHGDTLLAVLPYRMRVRKFPRRKVDLVIAGPGVILGR
jgi:hypothetical protein